MAAKKRYSVSFPHTGSDGKPREVGDHVELAPDSQEVRDRLSDGFIVEAAAPTKAVDEKK